MLESFKIAYHLIKPVVETTMDDRNFIDNQEQMLTSVTTQGQWLCKLSQPALKVVNLCNAKIFGLVELALKCQRFSAIGVLPLKMMELLAGQWIL